MLRSGEYNNFLDIFVSDGDITNFRRLNIFSSSFAGSSCHIDEYTQDAISYVRQYGCPYLFIAIACNPALDNIQHVEVVRVWNIVILCNQSSLFIHYSAAI